MAVSMPSCPAMRSAVAWLSPVGMMTSTPRLCSAAIAAARVSRGASAMPMTATALPLTAAMTAVRPVADSAASARQAPGAAPT